MIEPTRFFKLLSDETRLRILMLLHPQGEFCVCELKLIMSVSQPTISRHLAMLRDTRVVTARRDGTWVYYKVHPHLSPWAVEILEDVYLRLKGQAPYCEDAGQLLRLSEQPGLVSCA